MLRERYPGTCGLQSTVLGQYISGVSLPKFEPIPRTDKFVQVLHNYDHWVCVTNFFSEDNHDVFVYDSLYSIVSQDTVVQTSSLLRLHDNKEYINFYVRDFQNQSQGSRLCGLDAMAAATAACHGIDISDHILDENVLVNKLMESRNKKMPLLVPSVQTDMNNDVLAVKKMKLHCKCQRNKRHGKMIKCSVCFNYFHLSCVGFVDDDIPTSHECWVCSFCSKPISRSCVSTDIVTVSDEDDTTPIGANTVVKPAGVGNTF